jgi:hypothetical protein
MDLELQELVEKALSANSLNCWWITTNKRSKEEDLYAILTYLDTNKLPFETNHKDTITLPNNSTIRFGSEEDPFRPLSQPIDHLGPSFYRTMLPWALNLR